MLQTYQLIWTRTRNYMENGLYCKTIEQILLVFSMVREKTIIPFIVFLLFFAGILDATFHANAGEVERSKFGECFDQQGNTVDCAETGQDGDIQAGAAWPEPRFIDNIDGTITDNLTGLMWLQDAGCLKDASWQGALDAVRNFNNESDKYNCPGYTAKYDDWVLPNVNELEGFVNAEESSIAEWLNNSRFTNVKPDTYWTSTIYVNPYNAWTINMEYGDIGYVSKVQHHNVWPVRPISGKETKVRQTGQQKSYSSGDDGDTQRGISWPSPRFTDNEDGTITDNLTGLMWLKNASLLDKGDWETALIKIADFNSKSGDDKVDTHSANYADWRMPNRLELSSIIAWTEDYPALPEGHPFEGLQPSYYWSSTTVKHLPENAWSAHMDYGDVYHNKKSNQYYIWPVRSVTPGNEKIWKTAYWKGGFARVYSVVGEEQQEEPPQFIDNGDGTIINIQTGRMWLKDAGCLGKISRKSSLDVVEEFNKNPEDYSCTDYTASYSDWITPSLEDLGGMINKREPNNIEWLAEQGFVNIQPRNYWASTDSKVNLYFGWLVNMKNGEKRSYPKTFEFFVWPMRFAEVPEVEKTVPSSDQKEIEVENLEGL